MPEISLREALTRGLYPRPEDARREGFLTEARGVRVGPTGLETFTEPTNVDGETVTFPFPQVFKAGTRTVIGKSTAIKYLGGSDLDFSNLSLGAELVTNGDLASSTGWSFTGGASYDAANDNVAFNGSVGRASQSPTLTAGIVYRVQFTVTFPDDQGWVYPALGTVRGTRRMKSGTYTEYITSDGDDDVSIYADEFTGTVDDVSLKPTGQVSTLSSGNGWHFADLGDSWAMANGSGFAFKNPAGLFYSTSQRSVSCCAAKGRFVACGLSNWLGTYASTFTSNSSFLPRDDDGNKLSTLPGLSNYVFWSSIGAEDAFDVFFPDLYDEDRLVELYRRGEFGYLKTLHSGDALRVLPLQGGFVCYSENGITFFREIDDPPTFGRVEVADFGIIVRDAVGGDENEHLFLDQSRALWRLRPGPKLERLGYEDYFVGLSATDTRISVDSARRDFWIVDPDGVGRLLSPSGLSSVSKLVTSLLWSVSGTVLEGYTDDDGDTTFTVRTGTLNMGSTRAKTIYTIRLTTEKPTGLTVKIYYRNDPGSAWDSTSAKSVNTAGTVDIAVTAVYFQVEVSGSTYSGRNLEDLTVEFRSAVGAGLGVYV